jgi:hypothetical protein
VVELDEKIPFPPHPSSRARVKVNGISRGTQLSGAEMGQMRKERRGSESIPIFRSRIFKMTIPTDWAVGCVFIWSRNVPLSCFMVLMVLESMYHAMVPFSRVHFTSAATEPRPLEEGPVAWASLITLQCTIQAQ